MSDTYSESMPHVETLTPAKSRPHLWSRLLKWVLLVLVFLWVSAEGISIGIQHTRLRSVLTSRIATAFGRPVEVGSFGFSLWDGPVLEADSVTVAEDPRFGQEYFLRAQSMTVGLRWASLLSGHVELGTLSLAQPSLNLVRDAAGDWNLVDWLPQPSVSRSPRVPVGPSLPSSPLRLIRIEVDGGRINFKNGDEKLPLAFVGVKGTVETDRPGRWRVNLDATPWRAAVVVQQAGMIHLSGDLGGTSSRLRPAALDVSWADASISDVLRLAGGGDAGIRGALALAINARTRDQDNGWVIQGRAELRQVHRWDLALRPDTPSLNLIAKSNWNPVSSEVELNEITVEAPHSSAHASGRVLWNRAGTPATQKSPPVQITVSSLVDLADLLPWLRAFHPGVADSLSVRGRADVRAEIAGWPLQVTSVIVSSDGLQLSAANLRRLAHLGEVQFRYDRGSVSMPPVSLDFGAPEDVLRFGSSSRPGRIVSNSMYVSGFVSDVHDVLVAASSVGWNVAKGWDISGPVRADLRWLGEPYPWQSRPVGSIEWGAGPGVAVVRVPFLNQPIGQINAISEWKPGSRHIALVSAQAFGARWSGTFDRRDPAGDWQFALSADHLAAADLDRWLNPAWRESFLGRMLPFLNSHSSANAAPENLRASGLLSLDQFTLAPLIVRHLQGDLKIEDRRVELTNAIGQFYGGQVGGSFTADLQPAPSYHAVLDFSGVNISLLAAATPSLAGFAAESADGQISLDAGGSTRSDIVASLTCQGSARVAAPEFPHFELWKSIGGELHGAGGARFTSAGATFSCARRKVEFQALRLITGREGDAEGVGTVDFDRNLDVRFHVRPSPRLDDDSPGPSFHLTGSLAAPNVVPAQPPLRRSR